MAVSRLKAVQIGKETNWGVPVAATMKMPTVTEPSVQRRATLWQADFHGYVGPGEAQSEEQRSVEASINFAGAYELGPYPFAAFWGDSAPSGTGPYTYTYTAPYANVPSGVRSNTIEYGPPGGYYRIAGALTSRLSITGELGNPWQFSWDLMGRSVVPLGSPASLAFLAVNLIRMADTVLYIDNWGGSFGSTQITAAFIGFEVEFNSERHLKWFAGDVEPGAWGDNGFGGSLRLTLEFTPTTKAELDAIMSGLTSKLVRIEATSGSYKATIDFAGTYDGEPQLFPDRDGNVTLELNMLPRYSPDAGYWAQVSFVNDLSSLP